MTGAILFLLLGIYLVIEGLTPMPAGWPRPRIGRRGRILAGIVLVALSLLIISFSAHAATPPPSTAVTSIRVPEASAMYRRWVEQAVAEEWGVEGSPARLAAQIHQESSWNPKARSPVGAEGLSQFMPSTSRWIAQAFPERLGNFDPWDPQQAALAAAIYDRWLADRNPGAGQCSTWSFALSAYNGGETRLRSEQRLAQAAGRDRARWFGHVADMRARSEAAWSENRAYVKRIMTVLEPAYISAGWTGTAACV